MKKTLLLLGYVILIAIASSYALADLYLQSRTGNIYLNTTGESRLDIGPGGNIGILGLGNLTAPSNVTVGSYFTVDTGTLFVDSLFNRVGIGTLFPTSTLTVSGTVNATNFTLATVCADGEVLKFQDGFAVCGADNTGGAGGSSPFNSTSTTVFLNVTTAFVGIGTSTPGQQLHVVGDANVSGTINAPVINTTQSDQNITITSGGGSVIIKLG